MNSGACQANTCSCVDGTAATDAACTSDGAAICTRCYAGFTLSGGACHANTCSCIKGTAAIGAACTSDGAHICATCHLGYTQKGNMCVAGPPANVCPKGCPC